MINLKKDTLNLIKLSKKRKASGDFLGAISVLHSDEPFKKENIELLYEQGLFYFEMKNYNFALEKFLIYSQLANKFGKCKAYNIIGYIFLLQDKPKLASRFFDLQLNVSLKFHCEFDSEMYKLFEQEEKENNRPPQFKKVIPFENEFIEGVKLYNENKLDEALQVLSKIPFDNKFYLDAVSYKSKIFFDKKDTEKGLAYMREYFNHKKGLDVLDYCEFLEILAKFELQEFDYYLQELLKLDILVEEDYLILGDFLFKFTEKYDLAINAINNYEKFVRISPLSYSLKGLCYLYSDDLVNAKKCFKNAYLYSHIYKHKYLLNNTNKSEFVNYPKPLIKKFTDLMLTELDKKHPKYNSAEEIKNIFETALDYNNFNFWKLFIAYLSKIHKKIANFYLLYILVFPDIDPLIKVFAKIALAENNYIGKALVFGREPALFTFKKFTQFKTEKFKNAFYKTYCVFYFFGSDHMIVNATKLEDMLFEKLDALKDEEVGAIIFYYLSKDALSANVYRDIFNLKKYQVVELCKKLNISIKKHPKK